MRKVFGAIVLISLCSMIYSKTTNSAGYDSSRFIQVMKKAERGEPITIVGLGGSITKGYNASSKEIRWLNQAAAWWKITFPNSKINLVNAGIGGTGTDIAVHRLKQDVMVHNPDLILIEFSVNDTIGEQSIVFMEALIRQILAHPSKPAVMMVMLKQDNGTTAQESHKIVGNYYKVPMISFADQIDDQVKKDGIELKSIFCDGLHPVDIGMTYIANFVKDEFNLIFEKAKATTSIPLISTTLPKAIKGSVFDHTERYNSSTLEPFQNKGWEIIDQSWIGHKVGDEIIFKIDGNAISILYSKHNDPALGQAEIWVDNEKPLILDAYWTETWGPATKFVLAAENLKDGDHYLHIRILGSNSPGSIGHRFQVLNIQKAGNIK